MVTGGDDAHGVGAAVLLRGGEVVAGAELLEGRRPRDRRGRLDLIGPGKLCQALALDRHHDGLDLCAGGELWLAAGDGDAAWPVATTPRVGITGPAASWPLRFARGLRL